MNTQAHSPSSVSRFGAKEAGVLLLVTLIILVLGEYFWTRVIEYFREGADFYWFKDRSEGEIGALRSIALGFINPALMLAVSIVLLKAYLPKESYMDLCRSIGLSGRPSLRILALAFGIGIAYVVTFMGLQYLFPPNEFARPHPENVINNASIIGKILFALTACTLVPLAEEVLFRGTLYFGFANSWGKPMSALLTSVAFIALHPGTLESGYWVTHGALYLSPFLMVALREVGKTLYSPIAAHAGFNFAEIFF